MNSDRYTKVVLTVIAVGLWALTMAQVGTPVAGATEPNRPYAQQGSPYVDAGSAGDPQQGVVSPREEAYPAPAESKGPTSTLPLRWRVSWAAQETGNEFTWCSTAVVVTNTTAAGVDVEVEWMKIDGTGAALVPVTIPAYGNRASVASQTGAIAAERVNNVPWISSGTTMAYIYDFYGYALVSAEDPRIMVSAFQYCRNGLGYTGATIVSQTNIPVYPVGATAEFFQAGLPAGWPPPTALAEETEGRR